MDTQSLKKVCDDLPPFGLRDLLNFVSEYCTYIGWHKYKVLYTWDFNVRKTGEKRVLMMFGLLNTYYQPYEDVMLICEHTFNGYYMCLYYNNHIKYQIAYSAPLSVGVYIECGNKYSYNTVNIEILKKQLLPYYTKLRDNTESRFCVRCDFCHTFSYINKVLSFSLPTSEGDNIVDDYNSCYVCAKFMINMRRHKQVVYLLAKEFNKHLIDDVVGVLLYFVVYS